MSLVKPIIYSFFSFMYSTYEYASECIPWQRQMCVTHLKVLFVSDRLCLLVLFIGIDIIKNVQFYLWNTGDLIFHTFFYHYTTYPYRSTNLMILYVRSSSISHSAAHWVNNLLPNRNFIFCFVFNTKNSGISGEGKKNREKMLLQWRRCWKYNENKFYFIQF